MVFDIIYLDAKTYSREEISEFLKLDLTNGHFVRNLKRKLTNLGFQENSYILTHKNINFLQVPTKPKDKAIYLCRRLGFERVDVDSFSAFWYGMFVTGELQGMPWVVKAQLLKDNWNISINERTLRRWNKKLKDDLKIVSENKSEGQWWCTKYNKNGEIIRFPVKTIEEEEKRRQYWDDYYTIIKELEISRSEAFHLMWSEYWCTYYKCPRIELNCGAWDTSLIVEELCKVLAECMV